MLIAVRAVLVLVVWVAAALGDGSATAPPRGTLPNRPDSVKFAVTGDSGTGDRPQMDVARQMAETRKRFPFDFVIMVGDNFLGSQKDHDLVRKFDVPYRPLLDAGVTFHASIGNHDDPRTLNYAPLNMQGRRYYTFVKGPVRFFVLDSNEMDARQVEWLEIELRSSRDAWKIAYFHHPLYSNGRRHGPSVDLRVLLEPLLLKYGVSAVFSGHDHLYERLTPQNGIQYFVSGAGGKLRKGGLKRGASTAAGFDADCSFMVVEIAGGDMFFEAISRTGAIVDAGSFRARGR